MNEDGKIFYALVDNICVLKLVGSIMFGISPTFERFITKIVSESAVNSFVVDLTEISYIDSTNLGILAKLHEYSLEQSGPQPTIISTQQNINEVLFNVGFSRIFTIIHETNDAPLGLEQVPDVACAQESLANVMLDAHRGLMKLNETNRDVFQDVVSFLERDILQNPFSACS